MEGNGEQPRTPEEGEHHQETPSAEPQVPAPSPGQPGAMPSASPGMGVPPGVPGGYTETGVDTATAPSRGLSGARLTAAVTALVLVIAGAAVAVVLSGSDDGAALEEIVPVDTILFAKADLSPPGDQADNLRAIVDRFPQGEQSPGGSFREFLDEGLRDELGLTFSDDVAPWIGDEIGFMINGLDITTGEPRAAAIATVRDEARARATLQRVKDRLEQQGEELAFDVQQDTAFIAPDLLSLERALGVVEGRVQALSSSAEHQTAVERLGSDVLGVLWFDGRSLASIIPPDALPQLPGGFANLNGTGMLVLRAERNAAVIEGFSTGTANEQATSGVPAIVESTAADQIASLTLFDPAALVQQALSFADLALGSSFSQSSQMQLSPASFLAQQSSAAEMAEAWLQQNLGLSLEHDILPWMHGELSVVVGNVALPSPDIGVVIESTDDEAARRTIDALAQRLGPLGSEFGFEVTSAPGGFAVTLEEGITLVVRRIAGRVVIAGSDAYADELLATAADKLADDAVYQQAVGAAGQNVSFQMFVRLDRIIGLVRAFGGAEAAEAQQYLDPLGSFGMRATSDGDEGSFRMVVTFK